MTEAELAAAVELAQEVLGPLTPTDLIRLWGSSANMKHLANALIALAGQRAQLVEMAQKWVWASGHYFEDATNPLFGQGARLKARYKGGAYRDCARALLSALGEVEGE